MDEERDHSTFRELKPICVGLLKHSQLAPKTVPVVIPLLEDLVSALQNLRNADYVFPHTLVSYVTFPLLSLLRRNELLSIPDRVLELILLSLALLCEIWWWTCDVQTWEQLFMLCSGVVGGLSDRGKAKARDDETKTAAVQCLVVLTRPRRDEDIPLGSSSAAETSVIFEKFRSHAQSQKFVPVVGQTLNSLIVCADSPHRPLQLASLQDLHILLEHYLSEDLTPSVLPGVVSAMTRLALGASSKGWANGDIVAEALAIMQIAIVRAIGDDVCLKAGVVRDITDLEDFVRQAGGASGELGGTGPHRTPRTESWLRATASQLLIALNSITALTKHPSSTALAALAAFSSALIGATTLTLPNLRPLLISFLLALLTCSYPRVFEQVRQSLQSLLAPASRVRHSLLESLMQITKDHLGAIPRLLLSHSDSKVEHLAGMVEAVGIMASLHREGADAGSFGAVSAGIGKLFGPLGGVEKWGWRILSVLEFQPPAVILTSSSSVGQLMLETPSASPSFASFPELNLAHVATRSTQTALERMFVALGSAAGEDALFAAEWFASVGKTSPDFKGIAALWCACRLLEGMSGVRLADANVTPGQPSRKIEKAARGLARSMAEIWEDADSLEATTSADPQPPSDLLEVTLDSEVEHRRGLIVLDRTMGVLKHGDIRPSSTRSQPQARELAWLHKTVALHAICISAAILQSRFTPLLMHVLYPVLHSIVSPSSFSSVTGFAALEFITSSASYASPSNLLLSNFDYALDAVSRRLSREHLDVDAMRIIVLLVRLVGPDVVHRATDLVEECFARLDEYHGYDLIVNGLIEVLGEVVKAIEQSADTHVTREADVKIVSEAPIPIRASLNDFEAWFKDRHKTETPETDDTDYGPAPRTDWSTLREPTAENTVPGDEEKHVDEEKPPTPVQALTRQIVSRSVYFLTHHSPRIRAHVLNLLSSAVPVLPESALLQSVHYAWPFILNRLSDAEAFVTSAAAALVEALAVHVGSSMHARVWDDAWPIFRRMLKTLETSDTQNALARRGIERAGPDSVYANSFRLYCSVIKTMTASARHVHVNDGLTWEILLAMRRFLHRENHTQLQALATELYVAVAKKNEDAVWLALKGTVGLPNAEVAFLRRDDWDIEDNVNKFLE